MMNIRRTKRILWSLSAGLLVGGGGIIALALFLPYPQPEPYTIHKRATQSNKPDSAEKLTLNDFADLWGMNLRQALVEAAEPVSESDDETLVEVHTAARPDIRLVGYAVESENALAILMGQQGTVEYITVGEQIDGATVQSITAAGVLLDYQGDEYTLVLDDESVPPPTAAPNTRRVDRSGYEVGRYR